MISKVVTELRERARYASEGGAISIAPISVFGEAGVSNSRLRLIVVMGLVIGALLGMAGAFAPSPSLRGLAWGLDGTALIVVTALLTVHHLMEET